MNKNQLLAIIVFLLFIACDSSIKTTNQALLERFSELQAEHDYFKLKNFFDIHEKELSNDYSLFYGALIDSYFNHPELSNSKILKLLLEKNHTIGDSLMSVLLTIKETNHARLFEYKDAAETCNLLINNYRRFFNQLEFQELVNAFYFWKALSGIHKQELQIYGKPEIAFETDNRGFWNLNVELADTSCNFIFDTGAGTSMIKRSVAIHEGYKIIELEYPIKAFTGKEIETNLAIAEKIKIGDLTFDHVIFLVVDDRNLEIPNKSIPIGGIIGFPVISELKEICIRDGRITIPQDPLPLAEVNMAINNLAPLVKLGYQNDTLSMKFDTGALKSNFHQLFYEKYKEQIDLNLEKRTIRAGSIGGPIEFDVFKTKEVEFSVADANAKIRNLNVFTEEIKPGNRHLHGNLGLDYINQFNEINISFLNSTIVFK